MRLTCRGPRILQVLTDLKSSAHRTRVAPPGNWAQIATVAANVTTYSDTGVATSTTYWYRVRAYNTCNQSPYCTAALPEILLDDTWSSGIRTNQNLPTSSAWWSSIDTSLTAVPGQYVPYGRGRFRHGDYLLHSR